MTGVQTCALPIYRVRFRPISAARYDEIKAEAAAGRFAVSTLLAEEAP